MGSNKSKKDAPKKGSEEEPPVEPEVSEEVKAKAEMALERELRRYVKRAGGFRKGLAPAARKEAQRLMKKLGRSKPEWDRSIVIPGFDAPTVRDIVYPDIP